MSSMCTSFSSASAALAPASLAPASSTSNGVFTALAGFVDSCYKDDDKDDNCLADCWCENCQLHWEDHLEERVNADSSYNHLKSVDFSVDNKRVQGKSGTRTSSKPNKHIQRLAQAQAQAQAQAINAQKSTTDYAKAKMHVSKAKLHRPSKQDDAVNFVVGVVRDEIEQNRLISFYYCEYCDGLCSFV